MSKVTRVPAGTAQPANHRVRLGHRWPPGHLPRAHLHRLRLVRHHQGPRSAHRRWHHRTALVCEACGSAWPVACVVDWTTPAPGAGRAMARATRPSTARSASSTCSTSISLYRHARHYVGWTEDLLDRLERHATGHGARLVAVIWDAGIGFTAVRHLRRHPHHRTRHQKRGRRGPLLPGLHPPAA